MNIIGDKVINAENYTARVIDVILSMTEHNPVSLSDILGIPLKKLVLRQGFSDDEVSSIIHLGSFLSID